MARMDYLDFDLLLERWGTGYRARVLSSPAGQATTDLGSTFSQISLESFLAGIGRPQRGIVRDARRVSASVPDARETIKSFGTRLFDALFAGEVRTGLHRSLDEAQRQEKGLRIRLRLTDVPELAGLPWEYFYDPTFETFFVLSAATPVVRYLDLPQRIQPLAVQPPLRLLVVIASPTDYVQLDVDQEWNALRQALAGLEQQSRITLERLEVATIPALQQRLRRGDYNIFHFIGHGTFDEHRQEGLLVMEDETHRGRPMSTQFLSTLLHDEQHSLRLVILNACKGARTSYGNPFTGLAQGLVQKGIPAVIAMQFEITDAAAITLAREFYRAIADGYPVDAALAEARKATYLESNEVEWGTPALYMRAPDGVIWQMETAEEEVRMTGKEEKAWWEALPARVGGDMIIAEVGAGATGVAVGKNITQTIYDVLGEPAADDRQVIEQQLSEVTAALQSMQQRLDATTVTMAEFQLRLLQGELAKTEEGEVPSASTITQVGDWLLDNVPQIAETLTGLFATPAVGRVVGKAGEVAVAWVKKRFA